MDVVFANSAASLGRGVPDDCTLVNYVHNEDINIIKLTRSKRFGRQDRRRRCSPPLGFRGVAQHSCHMSRRTSIVLAAGYIVAWNPFRLHPLHSASHDFAVGVHGGAAASSHVCVACGQDLLRPSSLRAVDRDKI